MTKRKPAKRKGTQRKAQPSTKAAQMGGKRRSVWLEHELYERLKARAKQQERTVSYLMRRFIKRGLESSDNNQTAMP